ncbi:hypothetical protein SAMN05421821_1249 [Mucilaginibacter lappiensis]|uniref:Membrane protein n=1 Tax=Mucilaginibacter lappiensis TaxID=354630 RepID=A0ABR6PUQ7_9SPHI|nr:hypothetical protein [Mucilaginibacter lappiensis]MBB6112889.1 putative membrane protein [Mucilaginibacter lappiensis]SIS08918.1 hypothetical protein SAMN05421821_1249 [Mucilaginibacter lappiensis]
MKTKKMSFANIKNVLSKIEMKKIMAGSSGGGGGGSGGYQYCPNNNSGAGGFCWSNTGASCC